jgi:4-amino-4-deoxy-L-arabinose transferase-like glycosyltransferase
MSRRLLPFLVLLVFFALALDSARDDSPTMDEQNHIARGLAYLRTGDPRLSVEHPPLVNVISALPVLTQSVRLPTDDWSWEAGEWYRFADQLLWHGDQEVDRLVFLARLPIMLLALLLAALLHRAAREWFGVEAALLGLILYALDPNILAHSRYATTDLGSTAFLFLAGISLWKAVRSGFSLRWVILAGGAFGLALSAKLSAAVFGLAFGCLALAYLVALWRPDWRRGLAAGLRLGLVYPVTALLVVWAAFGFEWGALPEGGPAVPMPTFWRGVETVFGFSGGGRPAFLLGHFSSEGFWYYFPIAFAVKTPLPTLILLVWSLALFAVGVAKGGRGERWSLLAFLILPPALYFLISTQSALNLGYRHLLPALPYLYAFVGGQLGGRLPTRARSRMVGILLGWLAIGNLLIFPHYLSYFNEIVGPQDGYQVLVDSNLDWGQDLKRLKGWMDREGVSRVKLAWFGSAEPAYYGIAYDPLPGLPHHFDLWESLPFDPGEPEPGVYAISVSMLQELHRRDEDKTAFAWFRAREPDDRVGYSILIYRIGRPDPSGSTGMPQ